MADYTDGPKVREVIREVRGELETTRLNTRYTAEQKSNALDVLRRYVRILRHPYERCSFSGAGNCWCGRAEPESIHDVVVI